MPPRFGEQPLAGGPGGGGPAGGKSPKRLFWWGGGIAAVAVIAIVVSLVFVIGGSDSGYSGKASASPQAAAGSLLTALATRNPLEAANLLPPEEGDALYPLVKAALAKIKDAGIVDSTDPESVFSGVDFDTSNVRYGTTKVRDDLAKVFFDSLTVRMSVDASEAQKGVRDDFLTGEDATYTGTDTITITPDDDVFVMAVKGDSGWSISGLYTLLAYAADEAGYSADGGPVTVPQSRGADSPQEAVDATIAAGLELMNGQTSDVSAVAATLSPYEARAVLTYRTFLESELGSATELRRNDLTASVDSASTEDVGGGIARVHLDKTELVGTIDGDQGRVSTDSTCMQSTDGTESFYACLNDVVTGGSPYVIAQKDDGWHVSILGTAMDLGADVLGNVSVDDMTRLAEFPALATPDATLQPGGGSQDLRVDARSVMQMHRGYDVSTAVVALEGSEGRPYSVTLEAAGGALTRDCDISLYEGADTVDYGNLRGGVEGYESATLSGDGSQDARVFIWCADDDATVTVTYN